MRKMLRLDERLGYPVIETALQTSDCSHCLEDYVASYGGNALVDEWRAIAGTHRRGRAPLREDLFCEQRADQGWDYSILLPCNTLSGLAVRDPGKRGTLQRAINHYHADVWYKHRAHVTPVAGIPLHTPAAGIAHLEFAVKRLRFKAIYLSGSRRPPAAPEGDHDYDPFWSKVVELGVPVLLDCTSECLTDDLAQPGRQDGLEMFVSALFFGRVTRRFPRLRVGLLDSGSGWRTQVCTAMASGPDVGDGRIESFYFGLDSVELGAAAAFNDNRGPFSARINAICASQARRDHGSAVTNGLTEGCRLVDEGAIGEDDLRAYLFTNPYRLYSGANADFFKGTSVEDKLGVPAPQHELAAAVAG